MTSRSLRRLALAGAQTAGFARVVDLLEHVSHGSEPVLPVLMYHRVGPTDARDGLDPALLSATPPEFERQMAYVAARRRPLSAAELLEIRTGRMELPPRAVAVTFDDAYRDFAEHAWPVLRQHGVPATLFVPTAFPGRPRAAFWWDRLYAAVLGTERRRPLATPAGRFPLATVEQRELAVRRLRDWVKATAHDEAMAAVEVIAAELGGARPKSTVLSWGELRELRAAGIALAPHSRTHPLLNRLPFERACAEILGSLEDLEREVGAVPRIFAFPAGGRTDALTRWLPKAGFELAFTTNRGSNRLRSIDWFGLRRINVGRHSALPVIRAQLLPWAAGGPRRTRIGVAG